MLTIDDFRVELDQRITEASDEAKESSMASMNSYGAGYDAGFVAALREVYETLFGEP